MRGGTARPCDRGLAWVLARHRRRTCLGRADHRNGCRVLDRGCPPSGLPDVATQIITGGDDYIVADATSLDTYTSDLTAFGWDLDEG